MSSDTITRADYDRNFEDLRDKMGRLQSDLSVIAGAIAALANTGASDLREEALHRTDGLLRESQHLGKTVADSAARLESSIESSLRAQPVLAATIAAAFALLMYQLVSRR